MLGSKKGIRDISRGVNDMSNGVAETKIAFAKTPERALELMEKQRDREREQALKHQAKAKGIFTGPAELRAAKACEARANSWQRRIDKHIKANPNLDSAADLQPAEDPSIEDRLSRLRQLLDDNVISEAEHAQRRELILSEL